MKADELMIGDWVQIAHPVAPIVPREIKFDKVTGVQMEWIYAINRYGKEESYLQSYVTPIPLTEEILKANGFTNENEENIFVTFAPTGRYMVRVEYSFKYKNMKVNGFIKEHYGFAAPVEQFEYMPFLCDTTNDGSCISVTDYDEPIVFCQYIHELQHALRLCGLNELADNLKLK